MHYRLACHPGGGRWMRVFGAWSVAEADGMVCVNPWVQGSEVPGNPVQYLSPRPPVMEWRSCRVLQDVSQNDLGKLAQGLTTHQPAKSAHRHNYTKHPIHTHTHTHTHARTHTHTHTHTNLNHQRHLWYSAMCNRDTPRHTSRLPGAL